MIHYFPGSRDMLSNGWPETAVDEASKPYFIRRFEISLLDRFLLWGSRVIIPPPGHQSVFWKSCTLHTLESTTLSSMPDLLLVAKVGWTNRTDSSWLLCVRANRSHHLKLPCSHGSGPISHGIECMWISLVQKSNVSPACQQPLQVGWSFTCFQFLSCNNYL